MKGKSSVIFSRPCVNGQPVTFAVGLAGLHASGWDPNLPRMLVSMMGCEGRLGMSALRVNIRGTTCSQQWVGTWVRRSTANGLDRQLGPTHNGVDRNDRLVVQQGRGLLWAKQRTSAESKKM